MEDRDVFVGKQKRSNEKHWGSTRYLASGYVILYDEEDVELSRRSFSNRYNRENIVRHWFKMFGATLGGKYYTIEPNYEEY